jgi:hypothetical protein
MQTRINKTLIVATALTIAIIAGISFAQKSSVPKTQDTLALGEEDVKNLILLIDTQKTGKITKQEWMTFMSAEFDRLDTNKTGVIDKEELAHSRLRVSPFAKAGR